MTRPRLEWPWFRCLAFIGLNTLGVWVYGLVMSGRVEPLKFEPMTHVIYPLMAITVVVSVPVFGLLRRQRSRLEQALALYLGFVVIALVYGVVLWVRYPDGSLFALPLAVIGAHLYGWPLFLVLAPSQLLLGSLLFPRVEGDGT